MARRGYRSVADWRWVAALLLVWVFMLTSHAVAGGGPKNVLVVQNTASPTSTAIANYYIRARGIPAANCCKIHCSTQELVSKLECDTNIIAPIRTFLQTAENADRIDYIVLTKGIPLGADYGYSTGAVSVTSVLTCLAETSVKGPITNPYGPSFSVEKAFSHQLSFGGLHLYLVTRLDAYTVDEVYNMIDRSAATASDGPIALDRKGDVTYPAHIVLNDQLKTANNLLVARGIPTIYDDSTTFIGQLNGLMGYFGWGSNDPSFDSDLYRSNHFSPGSIADTFVSTSGRTFNSTSPGQSLIADLIENGACGVLGFVSEPYTLYITRPDVLFDRYTKGYNMAESFYMASPELFWKAAVVGDPLMAPYAIRPTVTVTPQEPLTGQATITADASSPRGISKVDFYIENHYVGSSTQQPFSITFDSTQYTVGPHKVEAVAIENGSVATQGYATAVGNVQNPVSRLLTISDAYPCLDGQEVVATAKMVVAGTSEMGGGEFYVEELDRSSGIRVISSQNVQVGDLVTVRGNMETISGERSVTATSVDVVNHLLTLPAPIGISNRALGGADANAQTKGVTGGMGLHNIGLYVRSWGRVTYVGSDSEDFFYIDDGSHVSDGSGHLGIKVGCRDFVKPQPNSMVIVTGLSSCETVYGRVNRKLRPRRQSDIVTVVN